MVPPGIMATNDSLVSIMIPCKDSLTSPASPTPSGLPSLLQPSFLGNPSVFHDHDYLTKSTHENDLVPTSTTIDDQSFDVGLDITTVDFEDVLALPRHDDDDATAFCGDSALTVTATENTDDLAHMNGPDGSHSNTPRADDRIASFSNEFLRGLDDLEFDLDLDEFDPHTDMAMEDTFQYLIDDTLNDSNDHGIEDEDDHDDDNQTNPFHDENNDPHKKEFFLKLLGLRAKSDKPRKEAGIDTFSSDNHEIALFNDVSGDNLKESTSSLPNSDCFTATVPSKTCSCAISDWRKLLVYSTAPACSKGHCDTSLSTATTHSPVSTVPLYLPMLDMPNTGISSSPGSASDTHPSPSHIQNNDADFWQWLEDAEEDQSSPTSASTPMCGYRLSNGSNDDVIQNTTTPSPPSDVHSSSIDLDSFMDIEDYASNTSPSFPDTNNEFSCHKANDLITNRDVNSYERRDLEKNLVKESRKIQHSQLRFRLSLLDDLSKGFGHERARAMEKRDAVEDTFYDFDFDHLDAYLRENFCRGDHSSDAMSMEWGNPPSPLSPSSPSSVQSSRLSSKGAEDSLDLLGLFSDENSSMLMERSDATVSNIGFL